MQNFFSHVAQTLRGALIGQLIPVIALPIISRLYTPDTYGVFASLLSIAIVLTTVMFLQFEVAVVLPKEDDEAGDVARTALQTGVIFCIALTIIAALVQPALGQWEGSANLQGWSILTPLMGFLMASVLLGNYIASRLQNYSQIGTSSAWLQLINNLSMVLLGLVKPSVGMLLASRFAAQTTGVVAYTRSVSWLVGHYKRRGILPLARMRAVVSKYRRYPMFSLPHTLTAMLSRESVTPILIFFHQPHAAGYYALVRAILMMPVSLLSSSVGQIFYSEASRGVDQPAFRSFVQKLFFAMAWFFTPGCVFIALWAPQIFSLLFGPEWQDAGKFVIVYMPVALLFILTTWSGRIFDVRGRQDILFRIQLVFDFLSIGGLIAVLATQPSPIRAIAFYAVCQVLYLLTYLFFVFRMMHLRVLAYFGVLAVAVGMAAVQAAIHTGIVYAFSGYPWFVAFGVELAILGPALLAALYYLWTRVLRSHFAHATPAPLAPDGFEL